MLKRLFQQFAKTPREGAVKTRLQPEFSPREACDVHQALMRKTLESLLIAELGPVELWLDELASHETVDAMLAAGARGPFAQCGSNLGERMYRALEQGLGHSECVVLVGSDCPGLDPDYLKRAFEILDTRDLVLGPAEDGGFVLVGCRRLVPGLFDGVEWGGESVLRATLEQVDRVGLRHGLLELRYDVDRPEDLRRWRGEVFATEGAKS